ncbi:hypothetical protein L596_013956 [Steinernema carpocapsae]|uniref:Uncharacterized protein n=1 Tax=Steinernema carpocapsae TaxID=34508 RepID=A0A4U5N9U6_STECR|nr:hypothetical protein L596_013956 [Steinernema carpocapsae]
MEVSFAKPIEEPPDLRNFLCSTKEEVFAKRKSKMHQRRKRTVQSLAIKTKEYACSPCTILKTWTKRRKQLKR